MVDYVKEIFERIEMQQITEFMRHGVECIEIEEQTKTYTQQIDTANRIIDERIRSTFPNWKEHEEIINLFDENILQIKKVYIEIGIKCGARLAYQLLAQDENFLESFDGKS